MRLLLIAADPELDALVRHHVGIRWPDADVRTWSPVRQGELPPEFLAQGYDTVLLGERSRSEWVTWASPSPRQRR